MDGEIYLHLRIKSTGGEDQKTQVDKLKRAVISLASKICHTIEFLCPPPYKTCSTLRALTASPPTIIQLLLIYLPMMKRLFLNEKDKIHQLNLELSLSPDVF